MVREVTVAAAANSQISYGLARWLGLVATLAAIIIAGGFLIPVVSGWRAKSLQNKADRTADEAAKAPDNDQETALKRKQARLSARATSAVDQSNTSPLSVLLGKDGRLSTSKTMAVCWTVVIFYLIATLLIAWPSSWSDALSHLDAIYLALLGGPFAALVLAKVAVAGRVGGTLQKTQGDGYARLSDLVNDDAGNTDIFDSQYVIFNLAAMAFVIRAFLISPASGFPVIPAQLVFLTGGPAAVYVSNKVLGGNQASIFAVTPSIISNSQKFTITGQNFTPGGQQVTPATTQTAGAASAGPGTSPSGQTQATNATTAAANPPLKVTVGGRLAELDGDPTDSTIVAYLDDTSGIPTGESLDVTVTTPAGQEAILRGALMIQRQPVITGLDLQVAHEGGQLKVLGYWNTPSDQAPLTVILNDTIAVRPSQDATANDATITVPDLGAGANGAQLKVALNQLGMTSNAITITVMP